MSVDEIQIINNLKHAWLYVLNSIGTENDLNMLKSINSLVGNNLIYKPGEMRTYEVSIGGTSWKPEIPNVDSINSLLEKQKSIYIYSIFYRIFNLRFLAFQYVHCFAQNFP